MTDRRRLRCFCCWTLTQLTRSVGYCLQPLPTLPLPLLLLLLLLLWADSRLRAVSTDRLLVASSQSLQLGPCRPRGSVCCVTAFVCMQPSLHPVFARCYRNFSAYQLGTIYPYLAMAFIQPASWGRSAIYNVRH